MADSGFALSAPRNDDMGYRPQRLGAAFNVAAAAGG
jgi:hypothetical protein